MTVKQLIEILEACNEDASVIMHTQFADTMLRDHQVYHEHNWPGSSKSVVVVDLDGTYPYDEMAQGKSKQVGNYAAAHDIEPIVLKMLETNHQDWVDFCYKWNINTTTVIRKDGDK